MDYNRWFPFDPSQKPKTPVSLFILLEIILILAYTVKSSPHRPFVFFIPFSCLTFWLLFCTRPDLEGVHFVSQLGIGAHLIINFFLGSANILLSNPQEDVKLLGFGDAPDHAQEKKQTTNGKLDMLSKPVSSEPFIRRLWWGIILWGNPRGINYAHEPTFCLPPRPAASTRRATYVVQTAILAFFHYCIWDISMDVLEIYDAHRKSGDALGFPIRMLSLSYAAQIIGSMSFLYDILGIVSVTLRITAPSDWPTYFNRIREGYTLRRCWGNFWHQLFRRTFSLHAEFFTKLLRLNSYPKIASYSKVFIAFLMSGLFHYAGDAMTLQRFSAIGAMKFFLAQPLGMIVEDAVLRLARRVTGYSQPTLAMRAIGFVWVWVWIGITVPMWIDDQLDAGYVKSWRMSWPRAITRLWANNNV